MGFPRLTLDTDGIVWTDWETKPEWTQVAPARTLQSDDFSYHQSWIWVVKHSQQDDGGIYPQTIRTVIASAPYHYRSFSRGRTCMDLDRTPVVWVKRISDYPPHFLNFKRGSIGSVSFSDAMCLESLDSGWTCYSSPVGGLVCPENTTSRLII